MSEVAEEESESEEESEPEEVSLPEEMSLPEKIFEDWEDDSYDWAKAIKDSLEKEIFWGDMCISGLTVSFTDFAKRG